MPRRSVQKCTRRFNGETIATSDELCLVWGHCFGVDDWEELLRSRAEFARLWTRWRTDLLDRWIEAFPGSRPAACYVIGEIPPPPWRHEIPALRHPVRIGGETVIEDRAGLCRAAELDHLVELGVVDAAEEAEAIARLAGPRPNDHARYRALAVD